MNSRLWNSSSGLSAMKYSIHFTLGSPAARWMCTIWRFHGDTGTLESVARAWMRSQSVMPPVIAALGWTMSTAPCSMSWRNSSTPDVLLAADNVGATRPLPDSHVAGDVVGWYRLLEPVDVIGLPALELLDRGVDVPGPVDVHHQLDVRPNGLADVLHPFGRFLSDTKVGAADLQRRVTRLTYPAAFSASLSGGRPWAQFA